MSKRKFRVGDKVRVIGVPSITFPASLKDEMGTMKLFKRMVGRVYTVQGFDKYGHIELWPKRLECVWIEPELVKLRARKSKKKQSR
jgi:hypothetical protein